MAGNAGNKLFDPQIKHGLMITARQNGNPPPNGRLDPVSQAVLICKRLQTLSGRVILLS